MTLKVLENEFTVCKITDLSQVRFGDRFFFIGKTDDELSLVCVPASVPVNITDREDGWRGFFIEGILDFSLTGILAEISTLLAKDGIGIFAISTYNTDYIFVKAEALPSALSLLLKAGYNIGTTGN
jgi:hypothetical protein